MLIDTPVAWPEGARCAVTLTLDFDAETNWLAKDPANIHRPGTLSQGTYGAKVGVPSVLQVLSDMGAVPATFFVPGWVAERHTDRVETIIKRGHEIGHHGYLHKWIEPTDPEGEIDDLERGLEALQRTVGVRPVGYRSPGGETSQNLFRLLSDRGFRYDSSMMDGVNPYVQPVVDTHGAIIELPWHWSLCDTPYGQFSIKAPRAIMPNRRVLAIWSDEFRAIYQAGGLFNLIMHPQVIGRPSRLQLLRDLIAFVQSFPSVWFATCSQVADALLLQSDHLTGRVARRALAGSA